MHLVLEHCEGNGEQELALTLTDLLDDTIAACHRTTDDSDTVALTNFVGGFAIKDLEIVTLDDGHETLHLSMADLHGVAMLITIGIETMGERFVPRAVQDILHDIILRRTDKDEMVQVAAQRTLIEHGIIVFIVVIRRALHLALSEFQVLEGDEEIKRIRGCFRGVEDLSLATENLSDQVCVGVTQDAPSFFLIVFSCYIATIH